MMDYEREIINRERTIIEQRNFLNDTDYKLLRQLDGGEPMDDVTKQKRKEARAMINQLEVEIAHLRAAWELEQESEEIQANSDCDELGTD